VRGLRRTLEQVDRQIAIYTQAIAWGELISLKADRGAAEQHRANLHTQVAQLDGKPQTAIIPRMSAALEHRLQGMTETLRSGVTGKDREAIEQSVVRIVVAVNGSMRNKENLGGLPGVDRTVGQLKGQADSTLFVLATPSTSARGWKMARGAPTMAAAEGGTRSPQPPSVG
jgi:hypothetical protein